MAGEDIDSSEAELAARFPGIQLQYLRKHSYPVLFYKRVRSTLVHEYAVDPKVSPSPMTQRSVAVSYVNEWDVRSRSSKKLIHFHFDGLADIVQRIAIRVEQLESIDPEPVWWVSESSVRGPQ